MPSDVARSFKAAQASEDRYIVVRGELQFNTRLMPRGVDVENQVVDRSTTIPAQFSGESLGLEGFSNDFATDVSINIGCAGPWCGGIASGHPFVMFIAPVPIGISAGCRGPAPRGALAVETAKRQHELHRVCAVRDCEPQDQF